MSAEKGEKECELDKRRNQRDIIVRNFPGFIASCRITTAFVAIMPKDDIIGTGASNNLFLVSVY